MTTDAARSRRRTGPAASRTPGRRAAEGREAARSAALDLHRRYSATPHRYRAERVYAGAVVTVASRCGRGHRAYALDRARRASGL